MILTSPFPFFLQSPPEGGAPSAPTGVEAQGIVNGVTLTWTFVEGLTYRVAYGTDMGGPYPSDGGSGIAEGIRVITGLTPGETYYFVVYADNGEESGPSDEVSGVPFDESDSDAATGAVPMMILD